MKSFTSLNPGPDLRPQAVSRSFKYVAHRALEGGPRQIKPFAQCAIDLIGFDDLVHDTTSFSGRE